MLGRGRWRLLTRRMVVTATIALIFATAVKAPLSHAAIYTCDTPSRNYFAGYDARSLDYSFVGTSSYITSTTAATCYTDTSGPNPSARTLGTNFTTSWVMIADYDENSYSQAGLIAGYAQSVYRWAEVQVINSRPGRSAERFDRYLTGAVQSGTKIAFYEQYNSACPAPTNGPCIESKAGSTRITDTNFDPNAVFDDGPYSTPHWVIE